jgi:hypothetical protein
MDQLKSDLSQGIFEPCVAKELTEAFHKAQELIDRSRSEDRRRLNRDNVARKIIDEALGGETQPDLVARAAVAKALIEQHDLPSRQDDRPNQRETGQTPVRMHPAGPHAVPQRTNEDATPGAGMLPSEQPGDDADPGTG